MKTAPSSRLPQTQAMRCLLWLLLGLGCYLRLRQYLYGRCLYLDEANLAVYIIKSSWNDLFHPLWYGQQAPIGFVLAEKMMTLLFGPSEYALRILPVFCMAASVPMFHALAKKYLDSAFALIALAFFIVSDKLIHYAATAKPYASDVAIVIGLYLTLEFVRSRKWSASALSLFAFVGALSLWFSFPAVFVLVSIGIATVFSLAVTGNRILLPRVLAVFAAWAASGAFCYLWAIGGHKTSSELLMFWENAFADGKNSFALFLAFLKNPGGIALLFFGASFFCGGIFVLWKKDKKATAFLLLPFFVTLAASAIKVYPFSDRLLLFLVPATYVFISAAMQGCVKSRKFAWMLVFMAFGAFTSDSRAFILEGSNGMYRREEIKQPILYFKNHKKNGDLLYIYYGAISGYRYYSMITALNHHRVILGFPAREDRGLYSEELKQLRGYPRVWVLFSHVYPKKVEGLTEQDYMLKILSVFGKKLDSQKSPGAAVYLFDLS